MFCLAVIITFLIKHMKGLVTPKIYNNEPKIANRTMIDFVPHENHICILSKANSTQTAADGLHFLYINYNVRRFNITDILLQSKAIKVKSNHQNYLNLSEPLQNKKFLLLSQNRSTIMVYNGTGYQKSFHVVNSKIVDFCFAPNRQDLFTFQAPLNEGQPYMIGYYSLTFNCSRKINITQQYNSSEIPIMLCQTKSLILNFTSKLRVYSLNQSLWNIKTIKNHGILSNPHLFGNIISVQNTTHFLLFNISSNYSFYKSIPKDQNYEHFSQIYFGNQTYFFYLRRKLTKTTTQFLQYDMKIKRTIDLANISFTATQMQVLHNQYFLYQKINGQIKNVVIYLADSTYFTNPYELCPYSNYSGANPYPCSNSNFNSDTGKYGGYSSQTKSSSNCLQYFMFEYLNIFNDQNNFDGCCIFDQSLSVSDHKYDSAMLNQSASLASTIITITQTARFLPQSFQYLAMFADDFQIYGYHNNSYPSSFYLFVSKAQIMNKVSMLQSYISQLQISELQDKQLALYSALPSWVNFIQIKNRYFLNVGRENYFEDSIAAIITFVSSKILLILLYLLSKKIEICSKWYLYMKNSTKWWTLLCGIFQTNIALTNFYCFLQFSMPSFIYFRNKLNLSFVILQIFFMILYCLIFYNMLFSLERKRYASSALIRGKCLKQGFFLESILFVFRNFIRGLMSGLFINTYETVIKLYVLSDIFSILMLLKFQRYFRSKMVRNFIFLYFLLLATLDIFYLLQACFPQLIDDNIDKEMFVIIVSLTIIACCLIFVVYDLLNKGFILFRAIKKICCCNSKKIEQQKTNTSSIKMKINLNEKQKKDRNIKWELKTEKIYKLKYKEKQVKLTQVKKVKQQKINKIADRDKLKDHICFEK